jgi:hypothetical protein
MMALEHGSIVQFQKKKPISPTCSIPFLTPIYESRNSLSHNGDIWIPNATKVVKFVSLFLD